jgi:hypothetical protein
LYQDERRSRIARERLLRDPQAIVESPERFLQRSVLEQCFGVDQGRRASSIRSSAVSTPAPTSGERFLKDYGPTDW